MDNQFGPTVPDSSRSVDLKKMRQKYSQVGERVQQEADLAAAKAFQIEMMQRYGAKTPEEALKRMQEEMAKTAEAKQVEQAKEAAEMAEVAKIEAELRAKRDRQREQAKLEDAQMQKLLREAITTEDFNLAQMEELKSKLEVPEYQTPQPSPALGEEIYGQFLASRGKAEGLAQGRAEEKTIDDSNLKESGTPTAESKQSQLESGLESRASFSENITEKDAPSRAESGGIGETSLADLMRQGEEERGGDSSPKAAQ